MTVVEPPGPTAVTRPLEETVAIAVLELDQVTALLVASLGATVAVSWSLAPEIRVFVAGTLMLVTWMPGPPEAAGLIGLGVGEALHATIQK